MIAGRLEIIPLIILLNPKAWKSWKQNIIEMNINKVINITELNKIFSYNTIK
jgi:hypothetical protein